MVFVCLLGFFQECGGDGEGDVEGSDGGDDYDRCEVLVEVLQWVNGCSGDGGDRDGGNDIDIEVDGGQ